MMMLLSEKLAARSSGSGRLFLVVLMAGLAVAIAFSMAFADDAQAKKKKKKKPRTPPTTSLLAPSLSNCYQSPVYSGETTARAWGGNYTGQLGDGSTTNSSTPVQVQNLSAFRAIAAGGGYSLALKEDGTVCTWGENSNGQLGDGTTTNRTTPNQVQGLSGVKAIDGGLFHSLAVKNGGTVFAWGWNAQGQLGDGTTTDRHTPNQVQGLSGVKAVDAGDNHSLALKEDGTVWAWGYDYYGQLGDGTPGADGTTPVQVQGLSGVKAIAAGGAHSLALKEDGTVWAWGHNLSGQLGVGATGGDYPNPTPVQVKDLRGVKAIAAGGGHSLALKEDGTVWAWGTNWAGQLGDGTSGNQRTTPVQVQGLSGVKAIDSDSAHALALKNDGTVWAWGRNNDGQLGDGSNTDRNTPVQVQNLSYVQIINAGGMHNLAKVEKPLVVAPQ